MSTTLKLSLDEYEQMIANGAFVGIDRRIELIDGELREMSPAYPIHFGLINRLNRWSISHVPADQAVIQIQGAVRIGDNLPEPDIAWLTPGLAITQRPAAADCLLIIEVAESSLEFDLGRKLQIYAASGVSEYWVVNIPAQQIHVHRQPTGAGYAEVTIAVGDRSVSPLCQPACRLSVAELFSQT